MDLYEAMRCAPTSRRFTDEPVPMDALTRVLENARFAPSGGNRQGWRVVVVRDGERRAALRELYQPHWRAYMEQTGGARVLADADSFEPKQVRGRSRCAASRARTTTPTTCTKFRSTSSSACASTISS